MIRVDHLDHIAIEVASPERSADWYRTVLGLERRYPQWDEPLMMCAGNTCIALFPLRSSGANPASGRTTGLRHLAFRVGRDMFEQAQRDLREQGIPFELGHHGIAHSLYIRDPDGYMVELTMYDA